MLTRTVIFFSVVGAFLLPLSSHAQSYTDSIFCGTTLFAPQTQTGGDVVTSFGTIKALFIFIDFRDDNVDVSNPTWPVGTGPNFLNNIVDLTETQNSGIYANVSTFFKDMSYGQFRMIGKAYYVQAPESLAWYIRNYPGSEAAYSARDAIQTLDQTVDFTDFDRWIDASYNHTQGADEVLDMVFICYRRWYICLVPQNYCSSFIAEGWYDASLPGVVYVDNSARRIVSSHAVDALNMIQYPRFEHVVHEFGHAWGLNHQYAPGFWSLMGHRFPTNTSFMNSVEREQLGWIAFHDITSSQTASLRDFGTYGDAYRIALGGDEYFILENHQVASQYDFPAIDGTRGLYLLRQVPFQFSTFEGSLKVETARGRYDWTNPGWTVFPTNGVRVPIFKRGLSNRTLGFNDRDPLYAVDPITQEGGYHLLHAKIEVNTDQTVFGGFYRGNSNDAYNLNYSTVFSPWSNPSACLQSGTLSSIGFEVLPPSTSTIDIQFLIGNPINASPSKPQDLRVDLHGSNPHLTWSPAGESDVNPNGAFLIERRFKPQNSAWEDWIQVGAPGGDETEWTDPGVEYAMLDVGEMLQYRIRAKDTQQLTSVYSDVVTLEGSFTFTKPTAEGRVPSSFGLYQCYPNPFNPTTNIRFDLPEDAFVSLKIYNMLGQEVATVVTRELSAGSYTQTFDASNLASGVYVYALRAGNFVATKKLLLMK